MITNAVMTFENKVRSTLNAAAIDPAVKEVLDKLMKHVAQLATEISEK